MSDAQNVVVTTLVAVDPVTAFEVFTADVDAWWKRGPRYRVQPDRPSAMRFEPGVGGRLVEVYDEATGDAFEHGKVRVWDPPKRLVFEMSGRDFQPGETTAVEVRFEGLGEATRVTVEHRGWERFPSGHPVLHGLEGSAFSDMMRVWWLDLLVAVQARVGHDGNEPG